jgi:hypothetical protein
MKMERSICLFLALFAVLCPAAESRAALYTLTITANNGSVIANPVKAVYGEGEVVTLVPKPRTGYSFTGWSGDASGKRLLLNLRMDGNKAVTANFGPWTPPIGIPVPGFGIFETYRRYDDPAKRNAALPYTQNTEGGYYTHYVDSSDPSATDTSNSYGSVARPRLSIPRSLPPGSVVEVHHSLAANGNGYLFLTGEGTAEQPIFVRGSNVSRITLETHVGYPEKTSYFIIEGMYFHQVAIQAPPTATVFNTHHVVIRDCELQGNASGVYPSLSVASPSDNFLEDTVVYGNTVHDYGVWDPNVAQGDNDYGALAVSARARRTWILDNEVYHIESAGIICSCHGTSEGNPAITQYTYIGRNLSHHNKQDGLWTKTSLDTIFSQNVAYGHRQSSSSSGAGMGFQYDPKRVWFLYNQIFDNANGINTGSSWAGDREDIYFIGNTIYGCTNAGINVNALTLNLGQPAIILANTIWNCPSGIGNGYYTAKVSILNNIIAGYTHAICFTGGTTSYQVSEADYNLLGGSGDIVWGATYSTLSAFQAGTGQGNYSVQADPSFVDPGNEDLRLQPASPAIDAGRSSGTVQQVCDRFQQLYGIDIRKDIEGRPRPQGSAWDIGAYEYMLGPVNNLAVSGTSQNSLTLTWAVSGEAGVTARPDGYDIRYSREPLTEANWEIATRVAGEPAASDLGQPQSFTIMGLSPGVAYYVALKTSNSTGSTTSPLSNVVSTTTPTTGNHAPTLTPIGDKSVVEAEAFTFSISATDADGDALVYSTGTLPTGARFDAATRTFTWIPTTLQSGRYQVMFQVSDGQVIVSETITVAVREGSNQAPVLAVIGDRSTDENALLSISLQATDLDGDPLTFSATGLPSGATLVNGVFRWTPNDGQAGSYPVAFAVSDGELTDSEQITITVRGSPNQPPALAMDQTAPVAQDFWPAADAIQVPLNTLIALTVSDSGSGIDAGTVAIRINDQLVYSGDSSLYESAYGQCRRTGTPAGYRYYYQPARAFDFDEHVSIAVTASDVAHNIMMPVSYQFVTEMRSFGRNQLVSANGNTSGRPALATDSQGSLWAAWQAGQAGARDIYVAKRGSRLQQWNTPLRLANTASDRCNPALAIGPDDVLYLAWQDNRRGNWDIYVSVSADGAAWGDPIRVADSNENQVNPVIAVDQTTPYRVYLAWERGNPGSRDIYLASCSASFASKTITQVTSNAADQMEPALTIGSDNTVYLLWTDQRNGSADIYGSSSAASSWSNIAVVTGPGDQSHPAVVAAPGTSTLHLVWQSDAAGNLDVLYGTSTGLPASPFSGNSLIDDTTGADQFAPSIMAAKDYANNVHVYACWQDNRTVGGTQDSDLYVTEIRSGAGGTNVLVGDDGTNSNQSNPALGRDEYGEPTIIWTDTRSNAPRIYSACSIYMEPVALASGLIPCATGGRIGADPASVDEATDVSIQIPAHACVCDVSIAVSKIHNLPNFTATSVVGYEIGPSGVQFSLPATVTIPYASSGRGRTTPYWYDTLTATLSQQGMTEITNRTLGHGISVISFKTTHLTTFYILESPVAAGSSGGGCALAGPQGGSAAGFFLPYGALVLFLLVLKWKERRGNEA